MKNFLEKIKNLRENLKKLTFTQVVFLFLGVLSVLIIINILIIGPTKNNTNSGTTGNVTDPDATGYQIRKENFGLLENILPYEQDNYSLTKETRNGVEVINITYDQSDPTALDGAYLYLKQYGLIQGDPRIVTTPRAHEELF